MKNRMKIFLILTSLVLLSVGILSACSTLNTGNNHPEYAIAKAWKDVGAKEVYVPDKPQSYDTIDNFTHWQSEIGYQYINIYKTSDNLFTVNWSPNGNPISNSSGNALQSVFSKNPYSSGKDGFTVAQLVDIIHKFKVIDNGYNGIIMEK
jgi:hypothetical protein